MKRMLSIEGGVRRSFTLHVRAGAMASARDAAEVTPEIPEGHLSSSSCLSHLTMVTVAYLGTQYHCSLHVRPVKQHTRATGDSSRPAVHL
jgi:hypothetical protein